ncbi:MAG: hypothetical protein ACI8X5_002631 [Planctomycetota bacterium]|jgi:hypothetical protein
MASPPSATAQDSAEPSPASANQVRLVVVINVDSMIPEHLDRLDLWWKGGFRRLLDYGTVYTNAKLPYARTESAPGHASFGTGYLPANHGITRNALTDPLTGRQVLCVQDEKVRTVSSSDWLVAESGSASSARLRQEGWAGALRSTWPGSRSISISGKGTSAALIAGKSPNLALWWDSFGRGFVSSSAYTEELPAWIGEWNKSWPKKARGWDWVSDLPGNPDLTQTAPDLRLGEAAIGGREALFPYLALELPEVLEPRDQAGLASRVYITPLMDRMVCDLAKQAVAAGFGADDQVDLIALSLSACDLLASAAGPYSLEVTEALLDADKELGALFDLFDAEVGKDKWTVVLSSDHGLLELPEGVHGDDSGAVRLRVRARRQALQEVRSLLEARFGQSFGANLTGPADGLTFSGRMLEEVDIDRAELRKVAAEALEALPWVAAAYTRDELSATAGALSDPWMILAQGSHLQDGGVEVEIRLANRHLMGMQTGTRSGSTYSYDRRQPLIFLGPGFPPKRISASASSLDALPTVLGRIGSSGREKFDGHDLLGSADQD